MKIQETNETLAKERNLLAAERTFSAWLRTALAAMAGGLAILRLIQFRTETHRIVAHLIGEILILWGGLLIILSAIEYTKIRRRLVIQTSHYFKLRFVLITLPLLLVMLLLLWVTFL